MKRALLFVLLAAATAVATAQTSTPAPTPAPAPTTYLASGKTGFGIDGVTSPNFIFRYHFDRSISMEVLAGFGYEQPEGTAGVGEQEVNGLDYRAGIFVLYHLTSGPLVPYVGGGGVFHSSRSAGFYAQKPDPTNSIQAGAIFGADYFLHQQFALGVKQFLGVDIRLKRDVPPADGTIAFGTGTWFTARYFL